ncbi:MAG: hypothetical protein GF344_03260 [Chitinivibrionales bacterium]|nr:hypothetical protein [Chitinivibrionales bacterium]MBD3356096.1 hypothetical protein [Chitinivibrionales bacterium]
MNEHTREVLSAIGIDERKIELRDLNGLDLSRKNLSGIDLRGFTLVGTGFVATNLGGADLRGIHFAKANCRAAGFVNADLRGADLAYGRFDNADFRGADLRGACFVDSLCSNADLSGADLRGALLGTEHHKDDFRGADLRAVGLSEGGDFATLDCDISGAILSPEESMGSSNYRKLERVPVVPRLKVFDRETSELVGELVDITIEGMKLNGPHPNPMGIVSHLALKLPASFPEGVELHVDARSVWCTPSTEEGGFDTGFVIQHVTEGHKLIKDLVARCRRNTLSS